MSDYGSRSDPRRIAQRYDARANSLKPVSRSFGAFFDTMPEEMKRRVLIERKIKQVHDQFAQVVDPFVLEHTNSVYLMRSKGSDAHDLVVYVDASLVAAELNARRELIRLKYRELFSLEIDVFEIRISKGRYRDQHPFSEKGSAVSSSPPRELAASELEAIDRIVDPLPEGRLKESFVKALKAQKRVQ